MTEWTEAERFLLGQIRRGDAEAWGQLVERYQGRLLAFARSRGIGQADAEDLVQDTFLRFLRGLSEFREQASIETYLFVILRRQVIEHFRGKQTHLCRLTESLDASEQSDATAPPAPDPTASWYVRRDEDQDRAKTALKFALKELADRLQRQLDFQSLQLLELLFYAQARNKNIAALLGVDEQHVGLQKHRWLKQLRKDASAALGGDASAEFPDPLLTQVWEEQRPTCPKRTTIGSYLLGSLDDPWRQYIDFHLNRLGCTFCQANLQDLQRQQQQDPTILRQRIMQSTIGFLRA
jgi:RNA polymerase sigma factor (sigma-70 family)